MRIFSAYTVLVPNFITPHLRRYEHSAFFIIMYSTTIIVLLSVVAANAAVVPAPVYSSSVVTSERNGDNFAYSVHDQQGFIQHASSMSAKPSAFSRALPGQYPVITPGSYVASGIPAGVGHVYGAPHQVGHHGITAYSAQPLTYAGQPLLVGHQAIAPGVNHPHVVVPQVKA
ncbi:uncharacterized protein LOC142330982 [Lycorma delicatula]|uniref:uncharacterized protein LOC142330982 n=1 Tax=Lycorma delicatula TaxID=130591 RepID=UPI003F5114BD